MSFASNWGSFDSLNVSTKCGFSPRAAQIRCTCDDEIPTRSAILRHDQCVWPTGLACKVKSTICSIVACGIEGLRPRPKRTSPNWANPSSANRSRHARTVFGVTFTSAAIVVFATPSAANNNARAR